MNAEQFYHVCRSAATIANLSELTVFGAAAVTPWIELNKSTRYWGSMEVDVALPNQELGDLVDGTVGELSLFHNTFGIYAHGLTLEGFIAESGWRSRSGLFNDPVSKVKIIVPSVVDLVVSKFARGDDRDLQFGVFCHQTLEFPVNQMQKIADSLSEQAVKYAPTIHQSVTRFLSLI